jgi:alcohol dehydrogenase (NADP+)
MKNLVFSNGDLMPILGLGTWKAKGEEVKQAVKYAVQCGYRHIDTAAIYGNEPEIGEALAELIDQKIVRREELFITSKLWNDAHAPEDVLPALKDSLQKLQLSYLDLYLIHWPIAFRRGFPMPMGPEDFIPLLDIPLESTWIKMEEAKSLGMTKHIGVSNFSIKKLDQLLSSVQVTPEVNQVELHPLLQQNELLDFCTTHNILLTAYSPLGSGDRSSQMKAHNEPSLFELPLIKEIAQKHEVHPAQVLIAWHIHRGVSVIPKSSTKRNIESNIRATQLHLDKKDMESIATLNRHYRYITGKFWDMPEKGYQNVYDE